MNVRRATDVVVAGLVAGAAATAVQVLLWTATGADATALLLRDARLTAALILGRQALSPAAGDGIATLVTAAGVHFALSVLFAAPLHRFIKGRRAMASMLAGGSFGALLYVVNLHVLTALFPWFAVARGGITLAAHLAFGLCVALVERIQARRAAAR